MAEQANHDYVSIIGTSYLSPIATLLDALQARGPKGPNEVQASSFENGYSASIIILTVMLLESCIARTQYIRQESPPRKPLDFARATFPGAHNSGAIEELFVVRDVIAHSHVWEARIQHSEDAGMRLVLAQLREGYGDAKFRRVLDPDTRTTRLLGLNLFPTRICAQDAVTVLKVAVDFLVSLEQEDRRYVYISPQRVPHGGDMSSFVQLVAQL